MKTLSIFCLLFGLCASLEAGLVITNKNVVKFGKVTEKKSGIVLEVKIGDMTGKTLFRRGDIKYFTEHEKVTNHYLGAKYAYKTKKYKVAKFLAERAVEKEPKNKKKAEELLIFIEKLAKVKDPLSGEEDDDDGY